MARSDPGNLTWLERLVEGHSMLAVIYRRSEAYAEALVELQKGKAILDGIAKVAPDNVWATQTLAWFDRQILGLDGAK
jgi:hypothetical protein